MFLITFSEGNGRAEVEEKNSNDTLYVMMMLTKLFCVLAVTFSVRGGSY